MTNRDKFQWTADDLDFGQNEKRDTGQVRPSLSGQSIPSESRRMRHLQDSTEGQHKKDREGEVSGH